MNFDTFSGKEIFLVQFGPIEPKNVGWDHLKLQGAKKFSKESLSIGQLCLRMDVGRNIVGHGISLVGLQATASGPHQEYSP